MHKEIIKINGKEVEVDMFDNGIDLTSGEPLERGDRGDGRVPEGS